jgi:hypothetical protein
VIAFLVVTPGADTEDWFESAAAADAAVAGRLHLSPEQLEAARRPITVDPLVVRRDGARWRSRQAWNIRAGHVTVRIYEMLQIDETLYDH